MVVGVRDRGRIVRVRDRVSSPSAAGSQAGPMMVRVRDRGRIVRVRVRVTPTPTPSLHCVEALVQ